MKKLVFCAIASLLLLSSIVIAEIPRQITIQGRLTGANDVPVPSASYSFQFNVYDGTGNLIWTETQSVSVNNGLFNAALNPPSTAAFDVPYYLEVRVGGNLLSPRVNITSSGYAFSAARLLPTSYPMTINLTSYSDAQGRDAIAIYPNNSMNEGVILVNKSNFWIWSIPDSDWANLKVRNLYITDNIGIRTMNPDRPLAIQCYGPCDELISFKNGAGTTKWHLNLFGDSGLNLAETGVADGRLFIKYGGNVGIGTTSPGYKLDVSGTARITNTLNVHTLNPDYSYLTYPYILHQKISSGDTGYGVGWTHYKTSDASEYHAMFLKMSGGAAQLKVSDDVLVGPLSGAMGTMPSQTVYVKLGGSSASDTSYFNSGNVGIGTTNPTEKLEVEGNAKAWGWITGDIIFQKDEQKLWRMFEDENGLYLENLKTGKIYKFALQEIEKN